VPLSDTVSDLLAQAAGPVAGLVLARTQRPVRRAMRGHPRPDEHLGARADDHRLDDERPWVMPHPARITLAGDASGSRGWLIDNAVLVEVLDIESHRLAAALVGNTETMVSTASRARPT
jgi:hypothetical protein